MNEGYSGRAAGQGQATGAQGGALALIAMSMMLPVFLGSVDQSILASALPTIGRDLGEVHNLPWLITSFLIASTALTPLYGKFADIHGRRAAMLIGVTTYMAGSLVCAASPNMLMLIFRADRARLWRWRINGHGQHARRHCACERARQILHLFLARLHDRRRQRTGARRMDFRSSPLADDFFKACGGNYTGRAGLVVIPP